MGVGDLIKMVPAAAIVGAAAAIGSYYVFGPYGWAQARPPACELRDNCVIVAGIDGDVNIGPGAGGEAIGIDIEDEAATRLVIWLEHAAPSDVHVSAYKYPGEIEMPAAGVANSAEVGRRALDRARRIGQRYNARLVVIGVTSGNSISMAFVDPRSTVTELPREQLAVYDISNVEWPARFEQDYQAALRAVIGGGVVPRPIPIPPGERRALEAPSPPIETPKPEEQIVAVDPSTQAVTEPISTNPAPPPTLVHQPVIREAAYERIEGRRLLEAYPTRAYEQGVEGRVRLSCRVNTDRRLRDCEIIEETPTGWQFGRAAQRLAEGPMRGTPRYEDGVAVGTGRVVVPIRFERSD